MAVSRYRVWMALAVILLQAACATWSEAGYSSGKSSMSRSSSGASRSSSSSSIGKGSSFSSGKGSSFSSRSSASSSSFGSAAASAKRVQESHSSSPPPVSPPPPLPATQRPTPAAYVPDRRDRTAAYAPRPGQVAFGRYVQSSFGVRPMRDGYGPWFWLWAMDQCTLPQARWAYQHRYVMVNPGYDALLWENADIRQRLAELERRNWGGDLAYGSAAMPVSALMDTDGAVAPEGRPLVFPWPVEAESKRAAMALEVERPAVAPEPAPVVVQTTGYAPTVDLAPYGYHRTSRIDDAFPLLFGAVFVMVLGGLLVGPFIALRFFATPEGPVVGRGSLPPPPLPTRTPDGREMPPSGPVDVMDDPLRLSVGQALTLDLPEYAGSRFVVERREQYTTWVNGQTFKYGAYWVSGDAGGTSQRLQLRVERLAGGALAVLALHVHDELDYSQELYNIVETDRTGLFQITDDDTGAVTAEYYRPEGVLSAYKATVTSADGRTTTRRQLQYWDYSRRTQSPRGMIDEYLMVEMEASGHFRILIGPQVDAALIGRG